MKTVTYHNILQHPSPSSFQHAPMLGFKMNLLSFSAHFLKHPIVQCWVLLRFFVVLSVVGLFPLLMSSFESPLPPLPPSSTPFPCQSPSQCHLRPPSCCCHFLPYTPFTPSFSHCLLHPSFWSSSLSILQCTVLCVHLTIPASHQTHFFVHHHHIATYVLQLVAAISFL